VKNFFRNIKYRSLGALINDELKAAVAEAIEKVEHTTSGEVVVMIAPSSSALAYVTTSWILLTTSLLFTFFIGANKLGFNFTEVTIIIVSALAFTCGYLLSLSWFGKRFFLHVDDRHQNVLNRARFEFHLHRLNKTQKATGVLIFVSLLEREAVVWGDELIAKKLPTETWTNILNHLIANFKAGKLQLGLTEAIEEVGQILKEHFPAVATERNDNEISNELILLED